MNKKRKEKKKILFVTPSFQSFIVNDINLLGKKYEVKLNHYNWKNKKLAPYFLLKQFITLLVSTFQYKFIVVSFGGYWSLFPTVFGKIYRKKVFIILHGTDCASIPELSYGSLRIPLLKAFCGLSYKLATTLLPVSKSLVSTNLTFYDAIRDKDQGLLSHFKSLKTPISVIHNGLDQNFWSLGTPRQKNRYTFIAVISQDQYYLKGADLITQVAVDFPASKFYIAGMEKPEFAKDHAENLIFLGKIPPEELKEWYQKTEFYFQLSIFEGFGCALAEAMLCGCIPIGSNVNHIPNIIGENGFILNRKDSIELSIIIHECLNLENKEKISLDCRNQIIKNFTLEKREKKIYGFLESQNL